MNEKFTLTLDSSQIHEFQMCPLKWWYNYRENLRLAGMPTIAPDKGTLIHSLCDLYYTFRWLDPNGNKLLQANEAINIFKSNNMTKSLFPLDNGELETFLCERFILYANRYFFNDFILPSTKESPVELGFSKLLYEDQYVRFIVEGRIDLMNIIIGDKLCFTDHKTQERENILYSYKPQFKTYAWATGCEYGMVNYIGLQKNVNTKEEIARSFKRQLIHFDKWMIDEWEKKMLSIFWKITQVLWAMKGGEGDFYIHRNDSYCGGVYDSHPCQFVSICETGDWNMKQELKKFKYNTVKPWSPWSIKESAS